MEEVAWKLSYRGEALSGQIGVRKGRRKCSGLISEGHRDGRAWYVWGTTGRSEL